MQPEAPLSAQVLSLFSAPRHAGKPESGKYHHGKGGAVARGSLIELWLAQTAGRISSARFEAFGCPATIACAEWLCRWLIERDVAVAQELSGLTLAEALELPAAKRTVALVAEDALKMALSAAEESVAG